MVRGSPSNVSYSPVGRCFLCDCKYQAALNHLPKNVSTRTANRIHGQVLESACRWYEFEVVSLDDSQLRSEIRCQVVYNGILREFFGFQRAKHAVIEAAGIVRNAPTHAERTALPLPMLGATNNDAGESGLTPFTADLRSEDELRHVPASNGGEVAFLPLDDARLSRSLDEVIARRVAFLTAYQNAKYAKRYSDFVAKVRAVESAKAPGSTDLSALSSREREVLALAARGHDNEGIATELTLSVRTVERHLQNVYLKLGLQGRNARTAAVARLLSQG